MTELNGHDTNITKNSKISIAILIVILAGCAGVGGWIYYGAVNLGEVRSNIEHLQDNVKALKDVPERVARIETLPSRFDKLEAKIDSMYELINEFVKNSGAK